MTTPAGLCGWCWSGQPPSAHHRRHGRRARVDGRTVRSQPEIAPGLHEARVPPGNIGYINVPSLLCIVATSVLTAPLGAKTAHAMDVKSLKRVFAMLLYSLAAYMAYKAAVTLKFA